MADWLVVRTVGTEEEAALIAGYLEAAGIDSSIESLLFHQEPVTFGRMGEVRILVDSGDLSAAERALAAEEERQAEAALDQSEAAAEDPRTEAALDQSEADAEDPRTGAALDADESE
jgi:hypothetical protein